MKKKLSLIIVLLIIGILSGYYLWNILGSPQYSLRQLDKAMDSKNVNSFHKYVDLDSTVDSLIEKTWQYYSPEDHEEGNRWDRIRQEVSNSLLSVVKPNLKERIKKEVLEYIQTGKWDDDDEADNNTLFSLMMNIIKKRIDPGQWDHQSINYTEIENDTAFVGLTYYDRERETNFIIEVKMRDMEGYWQIIEITNVAQLIGYFQEI